MLETADSTPGSLNRPSPPALPWLGPARRVFVEELSANPLGLIKGRFAAIEEVLDEAQPPEDVHVRAGLAPDEHGEFVRESWL